MDGSLTGPCLYIGALTYRLGFDVGEFELVVFLSARTVTAIAAPNNTLVNSMLVRSLSLRNHLNPGPLGGFYEEGRLLGLRGWNVRGGLEARSSIKIKWGREAWAQATCVGELEINCGV